MQQTLAAEPPEVPSVEPAVVAIVLDAVGTTAWSAGEHVLDIASEWAAKRFRSRKQPPDRWHIRGVFLALIKRGHLVTTLDSSGRRVVGHPGLLGGLDGPVPADKVRGG